MSDFQAPSSPVGSQFDVTNLDANVQRISALERTWRLPKLPDETKLDLAMLPGVNPDGLTSFLQQIDADISGTPPPGEPVEEEPEPVEVDPGPRVSLQDENFGESGYDLIRRSFAGLAGEPAPTTPTVDAVKRFKADAIRRGYLEQTGPIDSTWSPELNSIRFEMAFDDYDKAQRGDRFGAVDPRNFMDVLGDWTQPSSLLSAATELDLWWDFGAVGNEFSTWGDKFRKLQESDNPWEWGKNLVDAITGPIDDIVMPIVNWGLIASGVGGVYQTGRLAAFGARIPKLGNAVRGLYQTSTTRSVLNLAEIANPSWTALKLSGSGSSVAAGVGDALKGWRGLTAVQRTKQGVQAGMRLGVTSQLQDALPGYQGGLDLAGDPENRTAIGRAADSVYTMGLSPVFMPLELALAPYNIFSPGTFIGQSGAISKTASGLYKVAGTAGGRAALGATAGAAYGTIAGEDMGDVGMGALAGASLGAVAPVLGQAGNRVLDTVEKLDGTVFGKAMRQRSGDRRAIPALAGHVSDFLERTSFVPIANDQRVSLAYDRVMRRHLQGDDLNRWEQAWSGNGTTLSQAVGAFNGVDEEAGAAIVTWHMMTAAIDSKSAALAKTVSGPYEQRWHKFRNRFVGQLRTFDLDNITSYTVEDILTSVAMGQVDNPKRFKDVFGQLKKKYMGPGSDPSEILELASTHNDNARRTLSELMDDLDEDALYEHMGQTLDSFGRWDKFVSADSQITKLLHAGLLDEAEFTEVIGRSGARIKFRGGGPQRSDVTRIIRDSVDDTILLGETTDLRKIATNKNVSTLVQEQASGRITVARKETATAQQLQTQREELVKLRDVAETLARATTDKVDWAAVQTAAGAPLSTLKKNQIGAALTAAGYKTSTERINAVRDVQRIAAAEGLDPLDLIAQIDEHVKRIVGNEKVWTDLGLGATVRGDDSVMLDGLSALKARIKEIDRKVHYTAAEIDVDGLIAKMRARGDLEAADELETVAKGLADDGYKLVHGTEFIMPHDLTRDFKPFQDITRRHLHAETMGNAFHRRLPAEGKMIEDRRQRLSVAKHLGRVTGRDVRANDTEVTEVLSDLHVILANIQGDAASNIDKLWQENWYRRRIAALDTSFTPLRVDDLASRQDQVIEGLVGMGHDRVIANAAWEAIPEMRNSEFKDVGLYGIEAWLRKNNQGAQFLKFATGGGALGKGAYIGTGGYTGWEVGNQIGESEEGSLGAGILGAAAGAALGAGAAKAATKLVNADGAIAGAVGLAKKDAEPVYDLANSSFPETTITAANKSLMRRVETNRHGYMADGLVRVRDAVRFTLSPFFDISRYTEGLMLAQTAAPLRKADGTRMALHLNMSPTSLRNRHIKANLKHLPPAEARAKAQDWFAQEREMFRAAARGDFDPDVLDATGKWFTQIGIMGFNPTDWMTSAFIELRQVGGLDPEAAYKAVREMYTYGTSGRSAAELSVNFVLFPFSFQKKAMTHLTKWVQSDLGRSIMIHDAFKTYEILDEKYNLNEYWRDHAPMLEQLNKLNLFAYGVSGGQLGGINRRYIEPFVNMGTNYAMAMFTPTGASIKDAAAAAEFQETYKRLIPAINDVNWMIESVKQQSNVFTSESHLTIDAEIRQGYEEWNAFREEMGSRLERDGLTWGDLRSKPIMANEFARYELKRAELGQKYPAWFASRQSSTSNRIALEMEKNDRLARADGGGDVSFEDVALYETEKLLSDIQVEAGIRGMDFGGGDGWADAPPEVFTMVHQFAQRQLDRNPRFRGVWAKFYERDFGPLEAKV